MRFFRWWRRRRRARFHPIGEAEAYARSYGDRSDDVVSVAPVPPPTPPLQQAQPARAARGRISDAMLRRAFAARLASRSGRHG
jgi:hypothetical protein